MGALNLLKSKQNLDIEQLKTLNKNLSWIRTEMKYEVGSYTRKEVKSQLPLSK